MRWEQREGCGERIQHIRALALIPGQAQCDSGLCPAPSPEEESFLQNCKAPTLAYGLQFARAKQSALCPSLGGLGLAFGPMPPALAPSLSKHLFADVLSEPYKAKGRFKLIYLQQTQLLVVS